MRPAASLPPASLHRRKELATPSCIARLRIRIALEKEAEAIVSLPVAVVPAVVVGHENLARLAGDEAALGLVAQHHDKLGAIVGLLAQRLVGDDDRGSRQHGWRD